MVWKPIVVAVDDSPEAANAAAFGWRLADMVGTSCHLVHAVPDPGTALAAALMGGRARALEAGITELVGPGLRAALRPSVIPQALDRLDIRIGRTAIVLKAEVERLGAGLVIIGGKHHPALGRWLGGRTARDAVRILPVPVLVTRGAPTALRRVLAAVDLSYAAEPTIREAERFVTLAGGQLRAVHVVERVTAIQDVARFVSEQEFTAYSVGVLESDVWPLLRMPGAEKSVRSGHAVVALAAEATEWQADLLVVGSHGKGWVDRLLLGTVTERLLDQLPVSLLVVPVHKPELIDEPGERESHGQTTAPVGVGT
ncbi:MAG TPA: universal stress protein [Gemmatimonadales bacterium]|nr:universal stress protein [Gemmatimonadales bacterium]